ncbi:MAG: ECF transporter S component [Clostridia bacterium]|nr:ECF transporter S component [Clostridia bacterium]
MKKYDTKRIVTLGLMAALAFAAVALIRIPAVSFLKYEPKDVLLAITGFLFGPIDALIVTVVVSLVEMMTVSTTGPIGLLMNVISSCSFVCIAAAIYQKRRTLKGAVIGLVIGVMVMTAVMILWNYLITPIYQGVPRSVVAGMLVPVFLPFNLVKGTLNAALTMLLYKPVVETLRKAKLAPQSDHPEQHTGKTVVKPSVLVGSVFLIVTCILIFLAMSGKI